MVAVMAPKRTKRRDMRLIRLRERLELTQSEMAAKLGIKLRQYQNLEANEPKSESVKILIRLIEEGRY